ncbi:MAG TPA: hypothetical protein VFZ08_01680 [Terriglobia bacterium]|nr:hypothetical protein [Terriglobia bacterium]
MGIPGFWAERSVYGAPGRYGAAGKEDDLGFSRGVLPQLPKSIGFCMGDCDLQYDWGTVDNSYCKSLCFDDGGGNGGGGGGGGDGSDCRPGCGTCQRIDGRWQKACVNANCDVHYVACRPLISTTYGISHLR